MNLPFGKKKEEEPEEEEKEEEEELPQEETYTLKTFKVSEDTEYLDRYKVGDCTVTITKDHQYLVSEPQFPSIEAEKAYTKIMNLRHLLASSVTDFSITELMNKIQETADDLGLLNHITENYATVQYYVKRDMLGYDVIDVMMRDVEHLEDITASNWEHVGVMHRQYLTHEVLRSNVHFKNLDQMESFLEKLARKGHKHISTADPIIDFHLSDKYRVAIISGDLTVNKQPSLSVRLKISKPLTLSHMIKNKVVPVEILAVIWNFLDFKGTGLVIGGTGAGKTSFLNTLFPLLHKSSKVISIEDASELTIPQIDWTPLIIDVPITSPEYTESFNKMLNATLRHRPKMIAVGEVRGKSTKNLFEVMSTGHSSLSSFHATHTRNAVSRITTELGVHPASFAALWFIATISIITNKTGKQVRKCVSFDEVYWNEDTEKLDIINLSRYDAAKDEFINANFDELLKRSKKLEYTSQLDASMSIRDDLERRKKLLMECVEQQIDTPEKVMSVLHRD